MLRTVQNGKRRIDDSLIQTSRRNVQIKALPGGETRVYAPAWMRLREIDSIVQERAEEILRMHAALDRAVNADHAAHPVGEGSRISVEGRPRALRLIRAPRVSMQLNEDVLELSIPEPECEEKVRAALRQTLSEYALKRIRERLDVYQPRIGGEYGRVTIREQRTRWGSCSSKHNLNFNWKLIQAPPEALDYVVIHELCHLREFNHSPRFWRLVEGQMPEYEAWKKWLKQHGAELGV